MPDESASYELTGITGAAIPFIRAMEAPRVRSAEEHGLSSIEFRALFMIAEAGSLRPKQLADQLRVTNGAITGLSDRLIAAGLLNREAHPNDRRSLYLTLSPAGHTAMRSMHSGLAAMLERAVEGIDERELAAAMAALRHMTESIRE
ncbi:hypothetical protein B7R21_02610 [Subtercola boreus]|uniref:HTH marR-type domain-containing protein n=1 Tax=Subtercola boreus TaxID=120213 RepID=A0A3E0W409_9MICO|nr:MarR family transcriptional regulator [Subtercola boreus]RFA16288.1 hypothetical protein B7R21_02610 [Subtercola boreus]